jgi:hypothetical protein
MLVVGAVIALLLGGVGGWFAHGSSGDPDVIVAGGGELTERQEDMLDLFDEYTEAVLANDGAAVAEMFTENGTWSGDVGDELAVSDGTLEAFVNTFDFTAPLSMEPILVDQNRLIYAHEYMRGHYQDIVTFTMGGELQIVNHRILN